jgi:TPR repeat protein
MNSKIHSVLVEVDEIANVLRVWRKFPDGKPEPFRLLELPLNQLSAGKENELISVIGRSVLGGLANAHKALAVYIDDSVGMDAADLQGAMTIIYQQALSGDPLAQGTYGQMLCDRSRARLNPAYLEEAEEWFRKAAVSGDKAAIETFKYWPRMKQGIAGEIAKRLEDDA